MLRAIWHTAMRMTTQSHKGPFRQLHYLHQHGSKVPRSRNERIPETKGYAQSAPVNMSHFKALVEPPNAAFRKRYRFRWDWHLRNFLMALMPPGALLICLKLVEWRFRDDMENFGHLFPATGQLKQKLDDSLSDSGAAEGTAEDGFKSNFKASMNEILLQRMEKLEREMANLRAQQAVADKNSLKQDNRAEGDGQEALIRAKRICKAMVR